MDILEDRIGDVFVIRIYVDMFGDTRTQKLSERIRSIVQSGVRKIILDFKHVKVINSIGIGILMSCWSSVKREGGSLKLTSLNEKVRSLLEVTELDQFFDIHPDAPQALESFNT